MSDQPEALRLAEILEGGSNQFRDEAAAELRRLHALNAELVEALQFVVQVWFRDGGINYVDFRPYMEQARAALAKAEASK